MISDEFQTENGASSLFSTIVGVAIRAFLAITTAGFFYMYGGDIWSWILPYPMANYMASLTGVVLIDGLAFAWTYLRRASADTEEQQNYAKAGAWLDMALSLCVTGVFIILTTPLLAASVSAQVLTVLTNLAAWMGIIVGVVAFAGNGLLWHFFDNASSTSVQQLMKNQLRAIALKGEHALEKERIQGHMNKTQAEIRSRLPEYTSEAAMRTSDQYMQTRFGTIEQTALPSFVAPEKPTGEPQREYTRADRPAAVAASTRPAAPVIEQTHDKRESPPYSILIYKDGTWGTRKSNIPSQQEAITAADRYWGSANGTAPVWVLDSANITVYERNPNKNGRSTQSPPAPLT